MTPTTLSSARLEDGPPMLISKACQAFDEPLVGALGPRHARPE